MQYAFVTGMGRSGTQFLAKLLALDKSIFSEHEYIGNRGYHMLSWYLPHEVYAEPYLEKIKQKIETEKKEKPLFIDVNGILQSSVPALEKVFQPEKIFHLVRDPRKVIPSICARRIETDIHIVPKTRAEAERWLAGDKFYQVCWQWAHITQELLARKTELIRLENITGSYSYFREKIVLPLRLQIEENDWKKAVANKKNETKPRWYRYLYAKVKGKPFVKEVIPPYEQWSKERKAVFNEVCGEAMIQCGYNSGKNS